jgi:hypothetical protein
MSNLDILKGDNHERRLGKLDETFGGRLDIDVAAEWHTVEAELAERHIDLDVLAPASLGDLLGEALEETVELCATPTFLLLGLEFILVAVAIFPLAISSLVKLYVRGFAVELDVLGLLLAAHEDGVLEMNVNDDDELVLAWLEEEVADVGEQHIDPLLRAERRLIPDTILVNLHLAWNPLTLHRGPDEDVIQNGRASV